MKTLFYLQKIGLMLVAVTLEISAVKAQLVITNGHYQIDTNLRMIVCNTIPDNNGTTATSITLEKTYIFSNPVNKIQIGIPYDIARNDTTYKLYFTRLPLINLNVKNNIGDTATEALIGITDTVGASYHSAVGIKLRGNYSRTLPKKSYHIQLWADSSGSTTKDESIFGMRSDKTWLLLAMYNEKLRLNNKVSHDLWLRVHKLYYADLEPDAHSTIRTRYVEAFLNGAYQGVYLFTEDMDRKELKLKKQTTDGTGGELYKGAGWDAGTMFTGVPALPDSVTETWGGWELAYPDAAQTNWGAIHNFTDFVVNAPDTTFRQQILTKIRADNFADYFIFLNLLRAEDNQGKNLFLARYNETDPYFIAPWDLDGTWGYYWSGDRREITDDILTNNLFNRLLSSVGNFKTQLATRWFSLRTNLLSTDSLYAAITANHAFLSANGVYERESKVWSGDYLSYGQEELDYVKSWLHNRVMWLDTYFENFVDGQPIIYSFNASIPESNVVLNWRANCPAIYAFDVEASPDKLTWYKITPNSLLANDSAACTYSYTDSNLETRVSYYRLKVTDKNKGISYSDVVHVNLDPPTLATPVSLYPNPVSSTLQIRGNVERVNIYSQLGGAIYEVDGSASNVIDMQRFPSGMYLVRVTQKNGLVSLHKILVNQ